MRGLAAAARRPAAAQARRADAASQVRGLPDLRVRARKHTFIPAPAAKPAPAKTSADEELRAALASLYPRREPPLELSAGYLDTADRGSVLTASMQLDREALDFGDDEGAGAGPGVGAQAAAPEAKVDVWGIAIDDRGSFATFKQALTLPRATPDEAGGRRVVWHRQLALPPGLYQLRVAARDRRTGRTGSQSQWVEIPAAPPAGGLALSSVFLAEVGPGAGGGAARRAEFVVE